MPVLRFPSVGISLLDVIGFTSNAVEGLHALYKRIKKIRVDSNLKGRIKARSSYGCPWH
jgi:hypothetical protein